MESIKMKEALLQLDQAIDGVMAAFAAYHTTKNPAEETEAETAEEFFTAEEKQLIHYNMLRIFVELVTVFTESVKEGIYDDILRAALQDQ